MTVYLAAPAVSADKAYSFGLPVALTSYKTGQGFHLYRTQLPDIRPALIYIDCTQFNGYGPHRLLCGEMMGECIARGAGGIVLDISDFTPAVVSFCKYLSESAKTNGLTVYLPYVPGISIENVTSLVSSDTDRGSLELLLRSAASELGADNIALDIERVFRSYPLSRRRNAPQDMTGASPEELIAEYGAASFFSDDLCINYFTYRKQDGVYMTLYDNAHSIRKKLELADKLGIKKAFLYYPKTEDMVSELIRDMMLYSS